MSARKPSAAQRVVIDNLIAGRDPDHGLRGASAHGGHVKTMHALMDRGWIAGSFIRGGWTVTDAGREAVKR